MLNQLPIRGPKAFEAFCEALKADFQEHIVELYLTPSKDEKSKSDNVKNKVTNNEGTHVETSAEYVRIHSHMTVPSNSDSHVNDTGNLAISGASFSSAVQSRPHSSPPRLISAPDNHHQLSFHYLTKSGRDPNQNFSEDQLKGEARYKFQHYISDPQYIGLNNIQPRDITHDPYRKINHLSYQNHQSPRKFVENAHILIRNDSIGN